MPDGAILGAQWVPQRAHSGLPNCKDQRGRVQGCTRGKCLQTKKSSFLPLFPSFYAMDDLEDSLRTIPPCSKRNELQASGAWDSRLLKRHQRFNPRSNVGLPDVHYPGVPPKTPKLAALEVM